MRTFNWGGSGLSFRKICAHLLKYKNKVLNWGVFLLHGRNNAIDKLKLIPKNDNFNVCCLQLKIFPIGRKKISLQLLIILCVLFSGHLVSPAFGQEATGLKTIVPLKVGDKIPDALWNMPLKVVNHPQGKEYITLSDYRKGKLIILDFWATWCGSCLQGIAKNIAAQSDLNKYASIVYVTSENEGKIKNFLRNKSETYDSLSSIVDDTILKSYFPYRYLPHIVWIADDGIVKNISAGDALTLPNIKQIADKPESNLQSKRDIDTKQPLFLLDNLDDDKLRNYQIIREGEFLGLPVGVMERNDGEGIYAVAAYNRTLADILKILFYKSEIAGFHPSKVIDADNKGSTLYDMISFEYLNRAERNRIYEDAILFLLNSLNLTITDKEIVTQLHHKSKRK